MKKFIYEWGSDDIFLLHIQLDNGTTNSYKVKIILEYTDNTLKEEIVGVSNEEGAHRFMVSRSLPTERRLIIEYPKNTILEAFKILDRAYYPTESFYRD